MDVFTGFDKRLPSIKPKTHGKKVTKGNKAQKQKASKRPERMDISPERIRELVSQNTSKPKNYESSKDSKIPGFLRAENGPGMGKDTPKSQLTQSKLKGILSTNAFNFSDKERSVLDKILNKNS